MIFLRFSRLNNRVGTFAEKRFKGVLQSEIVGLAGVASAEQSLTEEAKKTGWGGHSGRFSEGHKKLGKSSPGQRSLGEG